MEQSHHDVGAMVSVSPEQCLRAAMVVCNQARDAEDAACLLEALGLRAGLHQVRAAHVAHGTQVAVPV